MKIKPLFLDKSSNREQVKAFIQAYEYVPKSFFKKKSYLLEELFTKWITPQFDTDNFEQGLYKPLGNFLYELSSLLTVKLQKKLLLTPPLVVTSESPQFLQDDYVVSLYNWRSIWEYTNEKDDSIPYKEITTWFKTFIGRK